jgi:hypothetical protein
MKKLITFSYIVYYDISNAKLQTVNMPRKSEGQKALDKFLKAAKNAPKETKEQKAEREQKRAAMSAKYAASNALFMAAYRQAHPVPEIPTGSPYQVAKEAWVSENNSSPFDHWTSANH